MVNHFSVSIRVDLSYLFDSLLCMRYFQGIAVCNFVLVLVHIKGSVEFGETGGFGLEFFFVGEGLFNLNFGGLQLGSRVFKLCLTGVQIGGEAVQNVVKTLYVAVDVRAKDRGVPEIMDKRDPVITRQRVKVQLQSSRRSPIS